MSILKKIIQLSAIAAFLISISFLRRLNEEDGSRGKVKARKHREVFINPATWSASSNNLSNFGADPIRDPAAHLLKPHFYPGIPKPRGSSYSRVMVVPRMKDDDISWIAHELSSLDVIVYVANDPKAPLHPPKNKGHEVMTYLSYIVDHYNSLPDIVIFMHSHRWTHHNNHLLGHDAVEMIRRLRNDHVIRAGYVNMRCEWTPGCPEWLHSDSTQETLDKQEEEVLSNCWKELFPLDPIPRALGQACCAQFAVSKERIRAIPLTRFVFYRDWIMRTPLSDYVSGRIWEYSWQFLFTGQSIVCPAEHVCYCDGFGVCFGGEAEYKDFERLRHMRRGWEEELTELRDSRAVIQKANGEHWKGNASGLKAVNPGRESYLSIQVEALSKEIIARRDAALERGQSPKNRAAECGRRWDEADGR